MFIVWGVGHAVIAIRVSSNKQFNEGDSPEAQREQLKRYALTLNAHITKTFIFAESGSKIDQPMQAAINYCKDPKNNIQLFIIKSIDRFTRGGAPFYDQLKAQLEQLGIQLVDIYGVISSQRVNTLEHLGVRYSWSEYSPSQKTEYLEAERAKDELRDILSRMIGAEVRYTRLGYWMRQTPYGFQAEKVETRNGKRVVLKPHPKEGPFVKEIFKLKSEGILTDQEIIDKLNGLGFQTRLHYQRDKHDRSKVIGKRGGNPLDKDAMDLMVRNPIYAGINTEKWTEGKPVRTVFDGLVDIEIFNRANRGKVAIIENGDDICVTKEVAPAYQVNKGIRNPDFPYRKFVGCSICGKPMYGSASRGYNGSYYPAYHCYKGHQFRVPKAEFEATIMEFVSHITIDPNQIELIMETVMHEWNRRQKNIEADSERYDEQIQALELEAELTVKKLKYLESETAIKYMESDLVNIEQKIKGLESERNKHQSDQPMNIERVIARVKYFLENLDKLLLKQIDPVKKVQFFGVFFDRIPTYQELKTGTENSAMLTGINELFRLASTNLPGMVGPVGLEPTTPCLKGRCSNRLSYGPIAICKLKLTLYIILF